MTTPRHTTIASIAALLILVSMAPIAQANHEPRVTQLVDDDVSNDNCDPKADQDLTTRAAYAFCILSQAGDRCNVRLTLEAEGDAPVWYEYELKWGTNEGGHWNTRSDVVLGPRAESWTVDKNLNLGEHLIWYAGIQQTALPHRDSAFVQDDWKCV